MSKSAVVKMQPNPKLFSGSKVGRTSFKPLQHKDGTNLNDVEYFELLGRKCLEMDKNNPNKNLPTNYGNYDRTTCELAKEVCRGIDAGMSKEELTKYIVNSIDFES